jgi:hypothetical protein
VPKQYWDEIYPIMTDEVLSMVKQERADKLLAKQGRASVASAARTEARQLRDDARDQNNQEESAIPTEKKAEREAAAAKRKEASNTRKWEADLLVEEKMP